MEHIIKQVVQFLEQGITAVFKFLELVWSWSFGQIVTVFQSDWQSLPFWKIIVLALIISGIIYLLYRAAQDLWGATLEVFKAFVALLSAFVTVMPLILISGLLAFGGGWIIRTVNF